MSTRSLYDLLPATHKVEDAKRDHALREFLEVIELQFAALNEDTDQLYDDQFIETCATWLTPYIGDLIGFRALNATDDGLSSRAEVANTIAYRRRKGTITVVEQLARDVTRWDANAVEFFKQLATTQYMNHLRPEHAATADMRDWENLLRVDTAFNAIPRTAEMRRISSGSGRYNIPNVGIHLWRLRDQQRSRSPAVRLDAHRFLFSPLGNDTQLFTKAIVEEHISELSGPRNVPDPLRYRVVFDRLAEYYGPGLSLNLEVAGVDTDRNNVRICNLSDLPSPPAAADTWARSPLQPTAERPERIAIDPQLGRIVFADPQPADRDVFVTYQSAFATNIGGGEYSRSTLTAAGPADETVQHGDLLQPALDNLLDGGVVEVAGSGRFQESIRIETNARAEVRAGQSSHPHISANAPIDIVLNNEDALVILDGLLISGDALRVTGKGKLILRHCTLVPGRAFLRNGEPEQPGQPAILLNDNQLELEILDSITGPVWSAPFSAITITNSIVDATDRSGAALAAIDGEQAGGELCVENSTVIGKVHSRCLKLVSNSILAAQLTVGDNWVAPVRSSQSQSGCVRFSYVPPESITPRRHRCQPDLAMREAEKKLRDKEPLAAVAAVTAVRQQAEARVRPAFASERYGQPDYMLLSRCVPELFVGADNEGEMGMLNRELAPLRERNLQIRLEEYLRFRLEAGLFFASQDIKE